MSVGVWEAGGIVTIHVQESDGSGSTAYLTLDEAREALVQLQRILEAERGG